MVEEVEDEEDMEMKRKPKAKGPGILEDVDDCQTPARPPAQPCSTNNVEIKVHPTLEFEPEKCLMGRTEHFLQRIKETKKNAMNMLRRWTSRDRSDEVTVFLLQSVLTAPYDQALETLRDLKQPQHYISNLGGQYSLHLPMSFQTTDTNASFSDEGLIDCGATGVYMDREFARSHNLNLQTLSHPVPVYNADKTPNINGPIRQVVTLRMKIGDHVETTTFAITNAGRDKVILGYSWLRRHNPSVDWRMRKLLFNRCPSQCNTPQQWEGKDEELMRSIESVEDDVPQEAETQDDEPVEESE